MGPVTPPLLLFSKLICLSLFALILLGLWVRLGVSLETKNVNEFILTFKSVPLCVRWLLPVMKEKINVKGHYTSHVLFVRSCDEMASLCYLCTRLPRCRWFNESAISGKCFPFFVGVRSRLL